MMEAMPAAAHQPVAPPVAAETVSAPRTAPAPPRSGLFAEAPRPASVPMPAAEAARPSLFSTVTGAFRRRQHHAPAVTAEPAPVRAEPATQEPRIEPAARVGAPDRRRRGRADIPAFLRRQSS